MRYYTTPFIVAFRSSSSLDHPLHIINDSFSQIMARTTEVAHRVVSVPEASCAPKQFTVHVWPMRVVLHARHGRASISHSLLTTIVFSFLGVYIRSIFSSCLSFLLSYLHHWTRTHENKPSKTSTRSANSPASCLCSYASFSSPRRIAPSD